MIIRRENITERFIGPDNFSEEARSRKGNDDGIVLQNVHQVVQMRAFEEVIPICKVGRSVVLVLTVQCLCRGSGGGRGWGGRLLGGFRLYSGKRGGSSSVTPVFDAIDFVEVVFVRTVVIPAKHPCKYSMGGCVKQIGMRISNVLKIITYDPNAVDSVGDSVSVTDKVGLDEIEGVLEGWVDGEEDLSFFRILYNLISKGSPLSPF